LPDFRPPGSVLRILLRIAIGFVGILALTVLFLVGTKIPLWAGVMPAVEVSSSAHPGASPSASPSLLPGPSFSPTPTATVKVLVPGEYPWSLLLGGECLSPFTSPWAEKFTVVDCATPHAAQLIYRGVFGPPGATAYPGAAALQAQINLLCWSPQVINLVVAEQLADVQVQGSFPATKSQWAGGDRYYYCFVSRASGKPLSGSLAAQ
jgi:hypothetical protein